MATEIKYLSHFTSFSNLQTIVKTEHLSSALQVDNWFWGKRNSWAI